MHRSRRDAEFSEYVAARRPQLTRTAYLLCGDVHRAEDVVQTALIKLYLAWPRIQRSATPDAFARRVMVNVHIDETRRPWRRERPGLDGHDRVTNTDSPEDRDVLLAALAELPAGQRRVVVLRHYWGLSVEETAADLRCSAGNVKSQTARGLKNLERALSPHFDRRR